MWVDEFLEFMGRLKGLTGKELAAAMDSVCIRLSLDSVRRLAISKLSRGYRQRVALAQALLGEPELLILDEPTNGLDPRQIIEVRELIRSLAVHHTILVTSHILGEIEKVATRVAILLDGRLLTTQSLERTGQPRLRLRIRSPSLDGVKATLLAIPGVTGLVAVNRHTEQQYDFVIDITQPDVAERLATTVTAAGYGLLEMTGLHIGLEELFLKLTAPAMP
jgi:ABC-2 type transport system ATP-binding protein